MWIKRDIQPSLARIGRTRPAVLVTGSRQAGKTSLLREVFPDHRYVSLDVPMLAEQAEHSGLGFLKEHPPPVILDEVQYAPALLRFIKADIDQHREDSGRFLLTGSQKFGLMQGVGESLAGRVAVIELHSLSAHEYEAWTGDPVDGDRLLEWIVAGGYPEVHARKLDPERFYADYLVTYLERDLRAALQVRSLRDFDRFMRLCAARTGQLLSMNQLASDVGVSPPTIKSWLSVLEASSVVCLLEPYFENLGKRIVKTPKLYFLDTGLACYLAGVHSARDLQRSGLLGALFETHVLGQIVRLFANQGRRPPLYFYRDHQGHEIDFLLPRAGRFQLIECKWAERPAARQPGFTEFAKLVGPERIESATIITSLRGQRDLGNGVRVADSLDLAFLQADES
jgi:predicted AAA+ superfamily ATPase